MKMEVHVVVFFFLRKFSAVFSFFSWKFSTYGFGISEFSVLPDLVVWSIRLEELDYQVCRVELDVRGLGLDEKSLFGMRRASFG